MATCIPQKPYLETNGERQVFKLLEELPDDSCTVWYEVVLAERNWRPDFFVLDENRGVIVVEVKDWSTNNITVVDKHRVKVKMKGVPRPVRNPDSKCQNYVATAKERLSLIDGLTDERMQLPFLVTYFVAFPNMTRADYALHEIRHITDPRHILFSEDLRSVDTLIAKVSKMAPVRDQPIDHQMCRTIRQSLRDDATVNIANTTQDGMIVRRETGKIPEEAGGPSVFAIDLEQEQIAKGLGEGPRLLRGPAGTGKTVIMLIRAKLMASNAEHNGKSMKVLVVCWNISLANYMQQLFENINIPLNDPSGVEIVHFSRWAHRAIHRYVGRDKLPSHDAETYDSDLIDALQRANPPSYQRYDAIFVDELQDFRHEWIDILFNSFLRGDNPKKRNFIAAGDYAQQIMTTRSRISFFKDANVTWATLGIPMVGRSKVLRKVYRNSARLWSFAGLFYGNIGQDNEDEDGSHNAAIRFTPKPGHDPEVIECKSPTQQIALTVNRITEIAQHYSPRNVLVLYRRRRTKKGFQIIERLTNDLAHAGIPYEWITEDNEAKSTFKWAQNSVKISTVHSAKGLDAPFVIILGAEEFFDNEADADEVKLMYVALTRAREYVLVLHTGSNPTVEKLYGAMANYERHFARIADFEQAAIADTML